MAKIVPKGINKFFSRYGILLLVGAVCIALVATSAVTLLSRGNAPEAPDNDTIAQTPEPTPDADPTPPPATEDISEPTPGPEPEQEPPPYFGPVNPLTGMPMAEEKTRMRPIAISINNIPEALPSNGISNVDIAYEMPFEGGTTRILGVFQDVTGIPKIGCIRSARHYTVFIAESHDAILVSVGGSTWAEALIRAQVVPHIGESGAGLQVLRRDTNRVPGKPVGRLHSVVLLGERMKDWLPERNYRITHEEDFDLGFTFVNDGTPQNGTDAVEAIVRFEGGKRSTFRYDPESKTYGFYQFNSAVVDANNDAQPKFTNVIVIQTSISTLTGQYSGAGRRDIITTGSGDGYFMCGGKYIEINWHREDKSPYRFTHKDGTELELGIGRTYVGIVPRQSEQTFS